MSYIVKKCPAYATFYPDTGAEPLTACDAELPSKKCQDRTNCVIKQVIEVCKKEAVINYPKKEKEFITVNGYQAILNMFDIEEINK